MKKIDTYQIEEDAKEAGHADALRTANEDQRRKREAEKPEAENELWSLVDTVLKHARKAAKFEAKRTETLKRLAKTVRANPALDSGDPVKTMSRVSVTAFAFIGAYAFDFILLGALSSYWISLLGANWFLIWIGKIFLPLAVLALEVGVATNLVEANVERRRLATFGWRVLSVSFVVFVAGYTSSMVMASEGFDSLSDMGFGDIGFLLFMVTLAVIPHALLLFSGVAGSEGKALLLLYWKRFRVHWNDRKYQKFADKTRVAFAKFTRSHSDHLAYFSCEPWDLSALFSAEARDIINASMGTEVIPVPAPHVLNTNGIPSHTLSDDDQNDHGL